MCVYVCAFVCMFGFVCVCARVSMNVLCMRMCLCIRTCVRACLCLCVFVCVRVCMRVRTCAGICSVRDVSSIDYPIDIQTSIVIFSCALDIPIAVQPTCCFLDYCCLRRGHRSLIAVLAC